VPVPLVVPGFAALTSEKLAGGKVIAIAPPETLQVEVPSFRLAIIVGLKLFPNKSIIPGGVLLGI
jgi:hypothetical protein